MTAELRWILLGLGALFIAGLAFWELRRPRHVARKDDALGGGDPAVWRDAPVMRAGDAAPLEVPEIHHADLRRDPPIVMFEEMRAADTHEGVEVALEVAVDRPGHAAFVAVPVPVPVPAADGPVVATPLPEVPEAPKEPEPPEAGTTAAPAMQAPAMQAPIQWPPARQERILWLRVMPPDRGQFSGRTLRQALASCGLVHGPQDIFHWADDDGRVIASAANLLRPGSFDLQTMDAHDYPGLHLFAVLPGPLTPLQTFNELLHLARDLAARLPGEVRDERGEVVDAARIEVLRASLRPQATEGDEAGA